MNAALLPVFGGGLHESWELHELRLLSWMRIHQIQQDNNDKLKIDSLILSLKPNSTPLSWFNSQPDDLKSDFPRAIDLLRKKFGSDLRKEMQRISALNCLQVRSFRDSEHQTEMVFELISELEQLLTCGSVDQDVQRREYLLRCFRGFSGALKMMNRTTSYDGALLAALNWESSVISKAEEAMIQAGIKRQLKSQNAEARTKRKSNSTRPVNTSDQRETTSNMPHANFTTQDFQANADPIRLHPDVYFKTHPPSGSGSHQQKPFQSSSHALQQRLNDIVDQSNQEPWHRVQNGASHAIGGNASSASATAYITPPAREETDPSQMMESLVDPHMGSDQFHRRPQRMDDQSNSYEHLGQMNQNEQEVLNHGSQAEPLPKIKPLIYDPKKNPYPPPEQLPENRHPAQTRFVSIPVPHASASQDQVNSYNRPVNSSQPNLIPFPSAGVGSGASLSFQPSRQSPNPPTANEAQQSEMMLPGASCSTKKSVNLPAAQYSFQRRSGGNSPAPQRRPSKLVKLRRNASSSSNNSSVGRVSNSGSLGQIRHFINSIHHHSIRRRRSQVSHSGDESDISSTQEQAIPYTPSSVERGGGNGSGSGMESEGNERMRPMQVQFSRLFRKHHHPEHVRQAHRAMLLERYSSKTRPAGGGEQQQKREKGKARAVDVNSAASGTVREFLARRGRDPAGSGAKFSLHSSTPLHATRTPA
ncbi:hypothetical protein PCANC_18627 [Puccinia coronata f. sp. avenae]|uniref:Uncharacterized protein n=1 Tax=Puccinia coronata f. sp. avenae TaxID=200324 RepID=A0A2N5SIW4_9BASI|nr:hypothetical protein PCANC_18627 [Puccinia coronata f. sp. avenae]